MTRWTSDGMGTWKSDDGRHRITYYSTGAWLVMQLFTDGKPAGIERGVEDKEPARRAAVKRLQALVNA